MWEKMKQDPNPVHMTGDLGKHMTLGDSKGETYRYRQEGLDQEMSSLPCSINENICYHLTNMTSFHLPNRSSIYILVKNLRLKEVK